MEPLEVRNCLSDETLAALVVGALAPVDLERVEAHLADCDECLLAAAAATSETSEIATCETRPITPEDIELGEFIARGGMAAVYRGRDTRTGRQVAVKRLNAEMAKDPTLVARFKREAQILRQLDHPNIVKILGCSADHERREIVMEYVGGGSLRQHMAREPRWPVDRALTLVLELCDALARAHHLTVVHRDIKPENVLISEDGTPRLTDFGLALLGDERLSTAGALLGTVAYLSPEALWGLPLDPRADLWGLGVMLFEMLAGQRPFRGDTPAQTVNAILHQPLPDLRKLRPDLPAPLVSLLGRMLEKHRERRIDSARRVGAELEALVKGSSGDLDPPSQTRQQGDGERTFGTPDERCLVPNNLPVDVTPFLGREKELGTLQTLLTRSARLVTVLGPGGMGKSRLALEASRRLAHQLDAEAIAGCARFRDGVFLVELARIDSPDLIVSAVADALGFKLYPGTHPERQLVNACREKQLLILLDNCEHVLSGVRIVDEILKAAPGVSFLATSRECLGLSSETQFVLRGMSVPSTGLTEQAQEHSAIQLFLAGARRVSLSFELSSLTTPDVIKICSLVEGTPLAVMLAASWVRVLSVSEIALEMSRGLDFLQTDLADVPQRQQSLQAVCDHSFQLLTRQQQVTFARLSVFRGGFTRSAARAVAMSELGVLATLVNKSLIDPHPTGLRYEIHELLRQYAEGKLRESGADYEETLDRHAGYHAELLAGLASGLKSADPTPALRVIDEELGNVHAAWRWMCRQQQLGNVSRALTALNLYYDRKGSCSDGEAQFRAALECFLPQHASTAESRRIQGVLLSLQGLHSQREGRSEEARELLGRALCLLDGDAHPADRALAIVTLSCAMRGHANAQHIIELSEEALRLYRVANDRWGLARALSLVGGWFYDGLGDVERAQACHTESIELQRAFAGQVVFPLSLCNLGFLKVKQGDFEQGRALIEQGLEIAESFADIWSTQVCLRFLAHTARSRGEYAVAEELASRNLTLARNYGGQSEQRWALLALGEIYKDQGRLVEAQVLLQSCCAAERGEELGVGLVRVNLGDVTRMLGNVEEAETLIESSIAILEKIGIRWALAIAQDSMGYLACDLGRHERARQLFERALSIACLARRYPLAAQIVGGLGRWHFETGERERAVELLSLVQAHPATERGTLTQRIEPLLSRLAGELSAEAFAAACARGRQLELESVLQQALPSMAPDA